MSRSVIYLDRGSKKRIRQIRWRPLEIFSFLLLFLGVFMLSLLFTIWMVSNHMD
jgi:hypothetical protein